MTKWRGPTRVRVGKSGAKVQGSPEGIEVLASVSLETTEIGRCEGARGLRAVGREQIMERNGVALPRAGHNTREGIIPWARVAPGKGGFRGRVGQRVGPGGWGVPLVVTTPSRQPRRIGAKGVWCRGRGGATCGGGVPFCRVQGQGEVDDQARRGVHRKGDRGAEESSGLAHAGPKPGGVSLPCYQGGKAHPTR